MPCVQMLSDNLYETDRPYRFYGFPLFVPQLAVSRLVEQPAEIADFLRRNRIGWFDNNIALTTQAYNPYSASITGYDFLIDGANAITRTISQATSISVTKRTVITNTWDRSAFENAWPEHALNATSFFTTPSAANGVTYVGRSIGEALVNAKLRYLRTSIGLNAYDYKVLAITTLYGLP